MLPIDATCPGKTCPTGDDRLPTGDIPAVPPKALYSVAGFGLAGVRAEFR